MDDMLGNPFFFELPSDRWSFTDRDELLPVLGEFMRSRGRRLLVHGRRRMGKTSLIQNAAHKGKAALIYVDLSKAASLADVAKKLLDGAPSEEPGLLLKAIELAKRHFKSITVSALNKISLSADFRAENPREMLEKVLNYLNDRTELEDVPRTICLDEFQDLRAIGGERPDWLLRGIIQEHRHLNYIFSGSDQRLLAWMTAAEAAFFKQLQQMEVGPIPPGHLIPWIDHRAKLGGVLERPFGESIVAVAGPCTGDVIRLAKVAFDLAAKGRVKAVASAALDSIALIELNGEFVARWADLTVGQRRLLQAVAAGKRITATDTVREYGLRSASTAQSAARRLLDRQILVRFATGMDFDSPFFKRWVAVNSE
jgi:hypothetical protein